MRERAESLDGELAVESQPGAGTCIDMTISLNPRRLNGLLAPATR
jgi:nitrate/nitrite-specific signal transduction histidine kinase